MVIRSKLYAPGNEPRKLAGVGKFGADAVILDLEDAVPVSEKETARQLVRETIPKVKQTTPHVYVRINPLGDKTSFSVGQGADDVEAIVCPELDGIVVPKVESEKELDEIDAKLAAMETRVGLPVGILEVVPIIETAKGLWNAYEIATRIRRVRTLSLGAGDLTRDLSIEWSRDEQELYYARSRLVLISRAAGIQPPTDSVWVRLADDDGFEDSARRARRMGFQGKSCIHPKQVEVANRVFSTSPEELAWAQKIVAAFDAALAKGSASILVDGEFVDYPLAEKARQLLEQQPAEEGKE